MLRRRKERILLPWEKDSRRGFLKKGLVGGLLLAAGGGGWLATRRTRPARGLGAGLQVFSPEEAAVLLAVADRLVPERQGFPRPLAMGLLQRVDAIAAGAHPAAQRDLKRLLLLFENALAGLVLDRRPRPFTESAPDEQDARLRRWAESRLALRRTGYRALKRLVYAAYYSSPETWSAVGYGGPPPIPQRPVPADRPEVPARVPEAAARSPARLPRPLTLDLEPRPLEEAPAPRTGLALPEDRP